MLTSMSKSLLLMRLSSLKSLSSAHFAVPFFRTFCSNGDNSFTISYLVESCGLSHDSASTISRYLKLRNKENPDRVLAFFRAHCFSDVDIARLIRYHPRVLQYIPEKNLLPKFEFFHSKGISGPDLLCIFRKEPRLIGTSLKSGLIPSYEFYRTLFKTDKEVNSAIISRPVILQWNLETLVLPRIDVLRAYGVPSLSICWLLKGHPQLLVSENTYFRNTVEKLKEFGFDTESKLFVVALAVMGSMTKASWDRKVNVYKGWGWSEENVIKAFIKQPFFMARSEEKIAAVMNHFEHKLGCNSSDLVKYPNVLGLSMERRIIPRTSFLLFLQRKGLLPEKLKWTSPLVCPEEKFLGKYVHPYEKKVPGLMKIYQQIRNSSIS